MQCHNCPKSVQNGGTPDEECLSCNAADYLDNDFKSVCPVDDISKALPYADKSAVLGQTDHSLETHLDDTGAQTSRNIDDCLNVIGVLKSCHHTSLPHIARIIAVLMAAGTGFDMAVSMLDGNTLSEYARSTGTSRQAASQKWSRTVERSPMLAKVPSKRQTNPLNRRRRNRGNGGTNRYKSVKSPIAVNAIRPSSKRRKACLLPKNGKARHA